MRFETKCSDKVGRAFFALEFLRKAFEENKIAEIENFHDIIESLDISQDLDQALQILKALNIEF